VVEITTMRIWMGISLAWLGRWLGLAAQVCLLLGCLVAFALALRWLARSAEHRRQVTIPSGNGSVSMSESVRTVWCQPYLRTIVWIVLLTTVASALVDYQFKELASRQTGSQAELAGFLGAVYGWTGGIALVIQLTFTSRFIAGAGVAWGLTVLPLSLGLGSVLYLVIPGLATITLVRGGDLSLRNSLSRNVLEFLYVPLPTDLRRKTKTAIDSVIGSAGDGIGALLVFLWVTWGGFASRFLSLGVILLAGVLIYASRHMGRLYFAQIVDRLQQGGADASERSQEFEPAAGSLLSATFTRLNLGDVLARQRAEGQLPWTPAAGETASDHGTNSDSLSQLQNADVHTFAAAVDRVADWDAAHLDIMLRLLARDDVYRQVLEVLPRIGDPALDHLIAALGDESADFVIRRRIPLALAAARGTAADDALLDALRARRFEIRYRAAIALVRRRQRGAATSRRPWQDLIWEAIRTEVKKERPVWELQRLLDSHETPGDDLVSRQVNLRGALSLEHTFRMLSLVLEPEPVRAAFHGIVLDDESLRNYALEYLEQVLPVDIRRRLWLFIGDVSEQSRQRRMRPLERVASDLMSTRATLFANPRHRDALQQMLNQDRAQDEKRD